MATTKTKTKTTDIIEDVSFESSKQSINRRVIYNYKNTKIRLSLKSDSYRQQCYAHAEALDGFEWKLIYSIPPTLMATPKDLRYYPQFQPHNADFSKAKSYFETDVQNLKKSIEKIL